MMADGRHFENSFRCLRHSCNECYPVFGTSTPIEKHWITLIHYKNITPKTVFKMAAVRHHEFGKISLFGHVTYICM